jgi:hypothetical protein
MTYKHTCIQTERERERERDREREREREREIERDLLSATRGSTVPKQCTCTVPKLLYLN